MAILAVWIVYGLLQIIAAYLGITFYWGMWAALALILVSVLLRFPLIITVGAFFGAWKVWGWHWALALIFAVPGLALLVPVVIADLVARAALLFDRNALR